MSETAVHGLERVVRGSGGRVPARGDAASSAGALMRSLYDTLRGWQRRYEGRRRLAELDDRLLRDVGLTRAQVIAEAAKPFWRA